MGHAHNSSCLFHPNHGRDFFIHPNLWLSKFGMFLQLETYLTAHSNMTVTHGICPECEKQAMAKFNREQLVP
jgi:hypothetical protein